MKKKKVLVGLSGGVDSAVAAHILVKQGYDVTCAFMRNWDSFTNNDIQGNPTIGDEVCPQEQDYMDAKDVADRLHLKLLRIDFVKEYWDHVFVHFLEEYKKGRTPNPDILCNKYIKFDYFFQYAMYLGFDFVATGHYAQVKRIKDTSYLLRGCDVNKDQTYFLCQVKPEALHKTLFPIGDINKQEVRKIAEELGLHVAKKKDSTGICFIGERNFKQFLQNYLPAKDGDIVDIDSKQIIGKHIGVLYYTIGQRKGLGIGGEGGPWFVVGKDLKKNILFVAAKEDNRWLLSNRCLVKDVNWFNPMKDEEGFVCTAKFRYRQKDHPVQVRRIDASYIEVLYPQCISSVTAGQEAVFYRDEVCLGGGVIDFVYHNKQDMDILLKEEYYGGK